MSNIGGDLWAHGAPYVNVYRSDEPYLCRIQDVGGGSIVVNITRLLSMLIPLFGQNGVKKENQNNKLIHL